MSLLREVPDNVWVFMVILVMVGTIITFAFPNEPG